MSKQTASERPVFAQRAGFPAGVPLPQHLTRRWEAVPETMSPLALGEPPLHEYGLDWEESCRLLSFIHCVHVTAFRFPVGPQFLTPDKPAGGFGDVMRSFLEYIHN